MSVERKPPETPGEHLAECIGIILGIIIGIIIGIPIVGFAIVAGGWFLVQLIDAVFIP